MHTFLQYFSPGFIFLSVIPAGLGGNPVSLCR